MAEAAHRTRLRGPQRRELIVEAAIAEFALRGYEAASLGRIALAAGVARTVLYDHFASKHALFVAVLELQQARLVEYLSVALASEGTTEQRWRATFEAVFTFVEQEPLGWQLLHPTNPPLSNEAEREYRRLRAAYNHILADLLADDARRAGLEPDSIRARVLFAIHREGMIAAARWWQSHPDAARAEIVDAAMAALWTGFGGLQPPVTDQPA